MDRPILVGAQVSEPKGVTIWSSVRRHFLSHDVPLDFALFSTYDAMDHALMDGAIDIAWNAPMAQAQTLIQSGGACQVLAMRDTDREVATVMLARSGSTITSATDLRGKRVALGMPISSELSLIPKHQLRQDGIDLDRESEIVQLEPREYPGGERWVDALTIIAAIDDGKVDAATLFEPAFQALIERGRLDPAAYRVVWRSRPFSHCGFAARPGLPEDAGRRFVEVLATMSYDDPGLKEMMDLEHLRAWVPADSSGWNDLVAAVREEQLVGVTF
jgi:ABC-type phosphate/phosphonate transport system substrate-binding protein